jgi:CelD/BcsL family acetyltransferase involved in cellulose biosynthesis
MDVEFEIAEGMSPSASEALWSELEARANPPFFLSWDWIGGWIDTAQICPAILIGRRDGVVMLLAAVMPATRRSPSGLPIHALYLNATGVPAWDIITIEYNGFLVAAGQEGQFDGAAIRFLTSGITVAGHRRDELHMKTAGAAIRSAIVQSGIGFSEVQAKPSYRIDLDTVRAAGKPYLDTLSANTRQQIRRSMRLYEQRGTLVATRAQTVEQAFTWLDELGVLHQIYWVARGEAGGFANPYFVRFQRHMLRTCLAKGTVELFRISAGEQAIGYVYNFVYRGHVYAYLTGTLYEDDAKLKPGLVNHVLAIEAHLAEGAAIYDFMAGDNRYKSSLGKPGPEMFYFVAQRQTLALRLESALRQAKHRLDDWRAKPAQV